jgi:hypothetical protein
VQHSDIARATKTKIGEALLQRILAVRRDNWEKAELKRLRARGNAPKKDEWKSRYTEPARPNATDVPELPDTWSLASLEMVAEIGSGISVSKNRLVQDPVELPYLRVANVLRGYLDLSEIKTIRVEKTGSPTIFFALTTFFSLREATGTSLDADGYGKAKSKGAFIRIISFEPVPLIRRS